MRKWPALALASALMISLAACGSDDSKGASSSGSSASSSSEAAASTQASESATPLPAAKTSGDQTALKSLKVKQTGKKTTPKVTFAAPVSSKAKTGAALINDGDGEALEAGKMVDIRIAQYNAKTGKELSAGSYKQSQSIQLNQDSFGTVMEDAYSVLRDSKVGADVGFYVPKDVTGDSAQIWVMHVDSQEEAPKKASAAEVKKLKAAGDLPTVKFAKGKPKITIPKGKDAPKDLVVDVIKEGDGKKATATSTVKAKYQGVRWADGKVFDGSYDKDEKSVEFGLSQVIQGWTKGLAGIKEGSTVLISIPASLAYGESPQEGTPAGALVFVVELDKVS